ncbi:Macrophage migration inhibitory factor-like protein [Aphelenchoides bicaudatus]|nr:Macrophage migration inhibitory factor-like protein [Aphelenchoides bicaudatus]
MPGLEITTNLPRSKIPADFLQKASKKVAELTSKPESYCSVVVLTDQLVSFGGTTEPAANVRLMSIGNISGEKTAPLVSSLSDFITSELDIPKNRYYIVLYDASPKTISFNGQTFA